MTTQLVPASTAFGLATAIAAYDSGAFEPWDRRILVVACTTAMPEATTPMHEIAGVRALMSRFDAVYDYNASIEPNHPSIWRPRPEDLPLWERSFRQLWKLGADDLHLVVESIQVNPAQALCRIFGDARIDVYADGLMSYGPTRTTLPGMVAGRIERLLHLDLVRRVTPLLLSEQHVHTDLISSESFRAIVKTMVANQVGITRDERLALIVGQHLAAGGLLSEREERDLYSAMVSGCVEAGHRSIAFKPHPSAPAGQLAALRDVAQDRGVQFAVADERELAEAWYERGTVDLVVGCFSTALMTASSIYGLPVARLGTELMLERLTPFQNSNRIPVTLVDALVPDISSLTRGANAPVRIAETDANALVIAVGYAMQPDRLTARRPEVVSFLRAHYESPSRYFKRRRMSRLGLPGSLPAPPPPPRKSTLRRRVGQLARRARLRLGRWLLGAEQSAHASHEQPHGSFTRCSLS